MFQVTEAPPVRAVCPPGDRRGALLLPVGTRLQAGLQVPGRHEGHLLRRPHPRPHSYQHGRGDQGREGDTQNTHGNGLHLRLQQAEPQIFSQE